MDFGNGHIFRWGKLYIIDFEISNSFNAFLKLNSNQENSLLESKKEFDDRIISIKKYYDGLDDIESTTTSYPVEFEEEEMILELQRIQRYSQIQSIFSFYEAKLKSISLFVESEIEFKIKLDDLHKYNGELMKYWTYLSKVFEIPINTPLTELFEKINEQKRLRNFIAHQDGILSSKQKINFIHLKGISFISDKDSFVLNVEKDIYIEFLLNIMKDFFEELLKVVDIRYMELKMT